MMGLSVGCPSPVHLHERERVALQNVLFEHIADNGAHLVGGVLFADGGILFVKYAKEPFPAGENVVVQKLHPVKAHDRPHGIQLVVVTAAAARGVVLLYYGELPPEDLRQKISVAAGRLQKRESMRSVSDFTRSHMALTSRSAVKTSPWSATRCLDLTCFSAILSLLLR